MFMTVRVYILLCQSQLYTRWVQRTHVHNIDRQIGLIDQRTALRQSVESKNANETHVYLRN